MKEVATVPIVKCAASKATPSKGINYIMDPEKVIARGSVGFLTSDLKKMAKQMMQTMQLFGKGKDREERKYYHAKVSFDPADRPENGGSLDAHKANLFAAEYAQKTWPGREVVWAVQDHGSSIHIHFILSACDMHTGKKLNARDAEYRKWKDNAQELAEKYGLSTLDWRKAVRQKRGQESQSWDAVNETFAEQGLHGRDKGTWKDELRETVDAAANSSCSMDEFRAQLLASGVTLTRCSDTNISYKMGDHKACRGDTLGGDYTVKAIQDALKHNLKAMEMEKGKTTSSISSLIGKANGETGRTLTSEERENARQLGRLAGITRAEVDNMIEDAPKASWEEKQKAWADYKTASNEFWEEYNVRQEAIKKELDAAYKKKRRIKQAEWELDGRNRYRSLIGAVFAYIYLERNGSVHSAKERIAKLKKEQEDLRTAAGLFKSGKREALERLREKGLSLDTYMAAVKQMQAQADKLAAANDLLTPADRKKLEKAAEKTKEQRQKRWDREGR